MKKLNTKAMSEAIEKIVFSLGYDVLKAVNVNQFQSAVNDFMPGTMFEVEKQTLLLCVRIGVGDKFIQAIGKTGEEQQRIIASVSKTLTEDYAFLKDRADCLIDAFTQALKISLKVSQRNVDLFSGDSDLVLRFPVRRRVCPVFFLLDCSRAMWGLPIGAVNELMEDVHPILTEMNYSYNADIEIQVAVLKFGADAEWITGDSLIDVSNFNWTYLDADGMASMGKAFDKLNYALSSKHGFLRRASGSIAPVIFLFTSGYAYDKAEIALERLKNNNWYKLAKKHAIVCFSGGRYDKDLLVKFTQDESTVLEVDDPNELANAENLVNMIGPLTMITS